MKMKISLSSYPRGEANLESLQNPVPNGNYTYFGMNPITHSPNDRRLNDQLAPAKKTEADAEEAPSGIKRRRRNAEADTTPATKDDGGLGHVPTDTTNKNVLPNGADMYYGLKPIEHDPITTINREMDGVASSSPIKVK